MKLNYIANNEAIKGYAESKLAAQEHADCVVRAIASAYDITYDRAHKWVQDTFSRKPRKGTFGFLSGMDKLADAKSRLNYKLCKKIDPNHLKTNGGKSQMSVGTFVKLHDKGTYIIVVSRHAFTVKGGQVIGNPSDATRLRKIIKKAWKIA